jgi:hypothetical protein
VTANPADFPVLAPKYMLLPARWRTRFDAIQELLAAGDPLLERFAQARATGKAGRDLEAQEQVRAIVADHRDLFPADPWGDPGYELAWAITCGTAPPRYRPAVGRNPTLPRELFNTMVPPLRPGRRERNDHLDRQLLALLKGSYNRPALTMREAADELNLRPSVAFHKRLDRLRHRGVLVPHAPEQEARANAIRELHDALRRPQASNRRPGNT